MSVRDPRSVPDVVRDIVANLQEIVRSEFRLAKIEVKEEARKAARAGTMFAIGLILALYAAGFVFLAAVHALSLVVPGWLASVIVGVALGLIAMGMVLAGKKRIAAVKAPEKTMESMRENVQWAKSQAR
jgi:uncharacterized membrane protein YqjE